VVEEDDDVATLQLKRWLMVLLQIREDGGLVVVMVESRGGSKVLIYSRGDGGSVKEGAGMEQLQIWSCVCVVVLFTT